MKLDHSRQVINEFIKEHGGTKIYPDEQSPDYLVKRRPYYVLYLLASKLVNLTDDPEIKEICNLVIANYSPQIRE